MQRHAVPTSPTTFGLAALAALALGCEISPVVTPPDLPSSRYRDCEHASEAYCEHVVASGASDLEKCVAEYTLKCVSGRDL
jgi:hypothetical protein